MGGGRAHSETLLTRFRELCEALDAISNALMDNELDFDDCGRDPGPCAIARALSQLQSSVAPRRMVMV